VELPGTLDEALRERVRQNLGGFARREEPDASLTPAAVALVLVDDDAGAPSFLLTRRASKLRSHGGQWALPGGRLDAGETPVDAALRELHEELGLALGPEQVLGLLDDYPTRSGYRITPVVAWGGTGTRLTPDKREVAAAYRVPLAELARPELPVLRRIPESERPLILIPLRTVRTSIHAPTAAILFQLREVALFGRATRVAHFEQPVFAWK
jgi:8-oxo-dGTP pyrophosphatase MutT (NUDIX family)